MDFDPFFSLFTLNKTKKTRVVSKSLCYKRERALFYFTKSVCDSSVRKKRAHGENACFVCENDEFLTARVKYISLIALTTN